MRQSYILIFFALLFIVSCEKDKNNFSFEIEGKNVNVSMNRHSDSLYVLELFTGDSLLSTWKLEYPVYRFDCADVTGDGIPEIAVGTIKKTRFDPKPDKRLFLFRVTDGLYIRPLWLGSRVGQPLEDFRLKDGTGIIRTIEKEQNGTYLVAEYKWKGFGLEFKEYIKREITLKEAKGILYDK